MIRAPRVLLTEEAILALVALELASTPRKPPTKMVLPLVSSLCASGDHLWCGGKAFLDSRNLSRRVPCECRCGHPEAKSA